MSTAPSGEVDRVESAADITLNVSSPASGGGNNGSGNGNGNNSSNNNSNSGSASSTEVPISRLDTTKEIEINEIRENTLKASGYSITSISYSGTMMFKGSRLTKQLPNGDTVNLEDVLYDENGVPIPCQIVITHTWNGSSEKFEHVLVTSDSYEVRNEETTETAFDWVAMDKSETRNSSGGNREGGPSDSTSSGTNGGTTGNNNTGS